MMEYQAVDLRHKLSLFSDHWAPKIIGKLNNYYLKVVKVAGHFTWHRHDETDEVFIVIKGNLRIDFRDGSVNLREGQLFIVEKGKEHKPYAENECEILLFEPDTTLNTGNIRDEFTKEKLEWI